MFGDFWGILKISLLRKTEVVTFWATLEKIGLLF